MRPRKATTSPGPRGRPIAPLKPACDPTRRPRTAMEKVLFFFKMGDFTAAPRATGSQARAAMLGPRYVLQRPRSDGPACELATRAVGVAELLRTEYGSCPAGGDPSG